MKGVDSAHRRNPLLFDLMPAGPRRVGRGRRPAGGRSASRGPAAFFRARFAPPSPLSLMVPSRGANSSHNSRAPARRSLPFFRARVGCPPVSGGRAVSGRSDRGPVAGTLHSSKKSPKRIPLRGFSLYFYFPLFIHFHSLGFRSPEVVLYQVNYRAGKQEYRDQVRDNHQTVEGIRQRPEQAQVHGGTDDCH